MSTAISSLFSPRSATLACVIESGCVNAGTTADSLAACAMTCPDSLGLSAGEAEGRPADQRARAARRGVAMRPKSVRGRPGIVKRTGWALLVAAAWTVGGEGRAEAADPGETERWRFAGDLQTDFPIAAGVRLQAEAPFRLRIATSVGLLPGPYVDAINAFLVGISAYDSATAELINAALQSSLVWRTQVGYRPFRGHGFHVEAGYGLVALGGGASAGELVAGVTGYSLPPSAEGRLDFDVRSTLHMANVEVGWEWTIFQHLHVRAALGGAFTFAAATVVKNDSGLSGRAIESFEEGAAGYLDSLYRSYVFSPVATVGLGGQL